MGSNCRGLTAPPRKFTSGSVAATKFRPPLVELEKVAAWDGERVRALLARDGDVVIRAVASAEELATAEGLFWDWLEGTAEARKVGLKRGAPFTHKTAVWKSLGYSNTGVMTGGSVGQSDFMWHCRMLPGVARAFAAVFQVEPAELVSSFDGCGSWRNYWLHGGKGSGTLTDGGW